MYTTDDLLKFNGHCLTKDKRYIIRPDGDSGFSYWHSITRISGTEVITGGQLGHAGYDYVFYDRIYPLSGMGDQVEVLNRLIN